MGMEERARVPPRRLTLKGISRQLGSLLILIFLGVILSLLTPHFIKIGNLLNVARQSSINAILAVGMTIVILPAGLDLSVASVMVLSSTVMGWLMIHGEFNPWVAVLAALAVGTGFGVINGGLVILSKIPPFIVTLGTMNIARGLAFLITGGYPMFGLDPAIHSLGQGHLWEIPMPVVIVAFIGLVFHLILRYTKLGLYSFAIGGNEPAARLSGIPVDLYKLISYIICGFLAAVAGVVMSSRLDSAQPSVGVGEELNAVAAVVIGGTSLFGGEGTIFGSLVGALLMGVIRNGLNLLNVQTFWQMVTIGSVLIAAVWLDEFRRRTTR